jgi:hypothetical protein
MSVSKLSIAAIIIAGLGFLLGFLPIVNLLFGIVGLILGILAVKNNSSKDKATKVLGVISICVSGFVIIIGLFSLIGLIAFSGIFLTESKVPETMNCGMDFKCSAQTAKLFDISGKTDAEFLVFEVENAKTNAITFENSIDKKLRMQVGGRPDAGDNCYLASAVPLNINPGEKSLLSIKCAGQTASTRTSGQKDMIAVELPYNNDGIKLDKMARISAVLTVQ